MATAKYLYRANDSLSKIAKQYNTNIKTLVVLNPWLVNPTTKKTELIPGKICYKMSVNADISSKVLLGQPAKRGSITVYLYSNADFTGAETILLDTNKQGQLFREGEDPAAENAVPIYNIDYVTGILTAVNLTSLRNNYGSLKVEFIADLNKPYLVVPLIGNGSTSIEDYWDNVDKTTGISLTNLIDNTLHDSERSQRYLSLQSPTDNSLTNESITDMIGVELLDTLNYYSHEDNDWDNSVDLGEELWNPGDQESKYLRSHYEYTTDFQMLANLGTIVSTALNEGAINRNEKFISKLNSDPYLADLANRRTNKSVGALDGKLTGRDISDYIRDYNYGPFKTYTHIGAKRNDDINSAVEIIVGNISITMPCWPEQLNDGVSANYAKEEILGRSEPYVIYTNTGEREIDFTFKMHREMLQPLGTTSEKSAEEIESIVRVLESAVYPDYDGTVSAVRTIVKVGKSIYIEGVMVKEATTWSGPIGPDLKYNQVEVSFTILETTGKAKSRKQILSMGGYRVNG